MRTHQLPTAHGPARQPDSAGIIHGRYDGNLDTGADVTEVHGIISGTVTVAPGGTLITHALSRVARVHVLAGGRVDVYGAIGSITVRPGGWANLHGTIEGDIDNPPKATVFITGYVKGRLRHPITTTGTHVQMRAVLSDEEPMAIADESTTRSATIRAWARRSGLSVADRGSVPAWIIAAYTAERTNTDNPDLDRATAVAS